MSCAPAKVVAATNIMRIKIRFIGSPLLERVS
jgi:hypothetical protein